MSKEDRARHLVKYGMFRGKLVAPFFENVKIAGREYTLFKEPQKLYGMLEEEIYSLDWILILASKQDCRFEGKKARELINAFYPSVNLGECEAVVGYVSKGATIAFKVEGIRKGVFIGEKGELVKRVQKCCEPFGVRYVWVE